MDRFPFPAALGGDAAAVRLAEDIDVAPLQEELSLIDSSMWDDGRPFTAGGVGAPVARGWTCFPLRSQGGAMDRTDPGGPGLEPFAETAAIANLPSFAALLRSLPCEVRSARLLALEPGALLPEHSDQYIGFGFGHVRLHFPIVTDPLAILSLDGMDYHWKPGEFWYGNFKLPHAFRNESTDRRVHLVVDCMVCDSLLELFPAWFQERVRALAYVDNPAPVNDGERDFALPRFALPPSIVTDLLAPMDEDEVSGDLLGSIVERDGSLVLRTDGGVECRLVCVGRSEYRFEGWTNERTLSFTELPDYVTINDRRDFAENRLRCKVMSSAGHV